jgi:hypothetical protein
MILASSYAHSANYELLAKHELPDGWHLTLVGPTGGPVESCGIQSEFESQGTEAVPKGKKFSILIIGSDDMPKGHYDLVLLSPEWSFQDGFQARLRFMWDDDDTPYELMIQRWSMSHGLVAPGINDAFLEDFAAKTQIAMMGVLGDHAVEIGTAPLVGSRNAIETFKTCVNALTRKTPPPPTKNFGDYLKDRL